MNISCSLTHSSQKPGQNVQCVSMKPIDVYPYNEILLKRKEGYIIAINNVDESQNKC